MCSSLRRTRHFSSRSSEPRSSHWMASKKLVLPVPFGPTTMSADASRLMRWRRLKPRKPSISTHLKTDRSDIVEMPPVSEECDETGCLVVLDPVDDELVPQVRVCVRQSVRRRFRE